jgi:hypothetical protein
MPPDGFPPLSTCEASLIQRFASAVDPRIACGTPSAALLSEVRRLSADELLNAIALLLGPDAANSAEPWVQPLRHHAGLASLQRGISAVQTEALVQVAHAASQAFAWNAPSRSWLDACLVTPPWTQDCINHVIEQVTQVAFRHPPTSEDLSDALRFYATGAAESPEFALQMLVEGTLLDPSFAYHLELGGPELPLTPHEVASRLSFMLHGAPPDHELLAAADDGSIMEGMVRRGQALRLLQAQAARDQLSRFFLGWLGLDESAQPIVEGGSPLTPEGLVAAAHGELAVLIQRVVLDEQGTLGDLLETTLALHSEDLQSLYGGVTFPTGQRAGILTRVGWLLQDGEATSPPRRGAKVARRITCASLHTPDPSVLPPDALSPPPFDPALTNRTRWEAKTSPAACTGCHAQINPLGFALENYDALGRYRVDEEIREPETGAVLGTLPVDSTVIVHIDGQAHLVGGAVELSALLAHSSEVHACFIRHWMRFSMGRMEKPEDACMVHQLVSGFVNGGSIIDAIAEFSARPEFAGLSLETTEQTAGAALIDAGAAVDAARSVPEVSVVLGPDETEDTTLSAIDSTAISERIGNFGGADQLRVFDRSLRRLLIRFDVNLPPTAQIISARLSMFVESIDYASEPALALFTAAESWVEGTCQTQYSCAADGATYDDRGGDLGLWSSPGGTLGPSVGQLLISAGNRFSVDVTPAVQAWVNGTQPNHGFLGTTVQVNNDIAISSSESPWVEQRPSLSITYTLGGAP